MPNPGPENDRYVVGDAAPDRAQNAAESVLSLPTNCCGVSLPVMNATEYAWKTSWLCSASYVFPWTAMA